MTRNDNIHRKDGAEMSGRKFPFYDAADGSLDPLFTSKLQEEAQKRPSKNMALMVTLQTESCVMMVLPSG